MIEGTHRAPLALLALGRSRRRMGWVVPVGAVLLVVAVVCAGAALMSGGAEAAVQGSAGAEVRGSESAEEMVTRVITYTYDPLYRLTGATYSTGESFAYAYDAVGNRTVYTETTPANGTRTTQYAYDAANRLLVSITAGQPITYTWDARGNLIGDGTFTYAYNSAGRLVRASSVTATLAYTYTADGLRVGQAVDGAETTFAWDWAAPVPEVLVAGSTRYLVGHEMLGWAEGGGWRYILPDALGSVRQVADGAGAVVQAREWMPYGEEVGGAQAGLGYTGEWQDADVGLVYLRARWYGPGVGRFTQRDPWEVDLRYPSMRHSYKYVGNNPLRYTDPSGRIAEDETELADFISHVLSTCYSVRIERDWGWEMVVVPADGMAPYGDLDVFGTTCVQFRPGYWTLEELRLVEYGVIKMGEAMGGAERFRSLIGPVSIRKTPYACGRGCASVGRIELLDQGGASGGGHTDGGADY